MKLNTPYTIVCKNISSTVNNPSKQTCSCDFRINIYDCPESSILILSNWILFSYCAILSVTAAASLWHLIKKKEQSFFLHSRRDRGKIRPRPQHIYFTMCLTYCPCQMVHSILLLTNSYPNIFWAELGHTLPTGLTATVAVLYPLSILYSTSAFEVGTNFASARPISTSSIISEVPITRHAMKTDLTCTFTLITTFCLFLTVAAITGHYADISDYTNANKLLLIQNFVWAIWGFLYILVMIWFWYRFISIVWDNISDLTNQHQTQSFELQNKLEQLRRGSRNLSLPVYGQIITVIVYIPVLVLYGLYHRTNTIFNYKINLLYMSIWYFTFPILLHVTQWIMIYNTATTPPSNSKKSTHNSGGTKPNEKAPNGKNDEKRKRTSVNSINEEKRNSEMTGISFSEFTKTTIDGVINVEEASVSTCSTSLPRRESRIRYIDQNINNNGGNGKLGGALPINSVSENSIIKIPSDTLHPNGKSSSKRSSKSYSNQTIGSDTSTIFTGGSNSNISNNINSIIPINNTNNIATNSPRFSSSNASSPTPSYPISGPIANPSGISRNSVTSKRESTNSNKSNISNTSTSSSSHQRREWLTKRPAPALSRSIFRDSYKSNI